MTKVLYKPVGMLVSVLGGVLAGAIFKQVWKVAFSEDDAPKATDADRSWREVLLAAALQGAIFGLDDLFQGVSSSRRRSGIA